ncbi:MAG: prepilin-type N-terminal cleavage/methylation domain-containing protein [Planctomycetota bacterium]
MRSQQKQAFTLIELLVVISIIALLIAILLPVLGSVQVSARRMQCGSNVRSMAQTTVSLAVDNDGYYRLSRRSLLDQDAYKTSYEGLTFDSASIFIANDHISHLRNQLFEDYVESGMKPSEFTCPERGLEYIEQHTTWSWRIGYYLMAGRDSEAHALSTTGQWIAPMSIEDDSQLPLAADVSESGTLVIDGFRTTYPHGPKGLVGDPLPGVEPKDLGVLGTNVAYNDGSTVFEPVGEMSAFSANLGGAARGYWPDVDEYDN